MAEHGVFVTVLILGLGLAAPVIWATLGELVAEQSGIINPGIEGVMLGYDQFQVTYSLIKATLFGGAIAFLCTYEGYTTQGGAEGVGKSTAKAVVVSSIAILILDALTAVLLAPYLQA